MTPDEAVLMDLLLERGYTREQAARALVALTLPETLAPITEQERTHALYGLQTLCVRDLTVLAERRGYLPRASATPRKGRT